MKKRKLRKQIKKLQRKVRHAQEGLERARNMDQAFAQGLIDGGSNLPFETGWGLYPQFGDGPCHIQWIKGWRLAKSLRNSIQYRQEDERDEQEDVVHGTAE